ncbi:MAG: DUF1385 domain-containing protein [Terriglobia bacterium]
MLNRIKEKSRHVLRRFIWLAALPLLQGPEEVLVGGQAVIEGVMMRSPHSYAVAVRKPDGSLAVTRDFLARPSEKHKWWKWPLLRGLGTLGQAMVLGIRALRFSAQEALADDNTDKEAASAEGKKKKDLSNALLALNLILSLGFFILFYKLVPLYLATRAQKHFTVFGSYIMFNLLDGIIRIVLFLGFLYLLSRSQEIRRVFEYHGAEHKVVWAFEKTGRTELAEARRSTRFHPRCGTSFLLVVMVIALIVYLFLPFHSFAAKFWSRILLLPLIAGLSYEFIRYAAKAKGWIWKAAAAPGLWLQRVTTREPDDSQLETAIRALDTAMELERSRGGELVVA